ncbi:MAG: hypothetical protein M0O96_11445 [Desulforhopalus sp.]|nr:hypothetical protein [Desulforhopalus sp.]
MSNSNRKFLWVAALIVIAILYAVIYKNFIGATGGIVAPFAVGLVISGVWWGIQLIRKRSWQWYNWLTLASVIIILLIATQYAINFL